MPTSHSKIPEEQAEKIDAISIESLELSVRATNLLKFFNLLTLKDLEWRTKTPYEIRKHLQTLKGFGKQSAMEVSCAVANIVTNAEGPKRDLISVPHDMADFILLNLKIIEGLRQGKLKVIHEIGMRFY